MSKFCVFAGTAEGRAMVEFLCARGAEVTACVTTEYGETLLPEADNLTVSARPLPEEEIREILRREHFDLVIDATHPYAVHITESVASACAAEGVEHLRLLRDGDEGTTGAIWLDDAEAVTEYLKQTEGNVLLTTGSKDLPRFAELPDFARRVYARVLPMEDSLKVCREAGLPPSHILAMQGPFSKEMNLAMLRATGAAFLVTKDSGRAGGFGEKAAAAAEAGASLVVLGRPPQREGVAWEEALRLLEERFGFPSEERQRGIGPEIVTPGLPDDAFLRVEGIPMTKSEVRAVALSKLRLTRDAVCWDIGAGTGSVVVEMGRLADRGAVYAIERRAEAAALIGENTRRHRLKNVMMIPGTAPHACKDLPAPTHAFVGGSSGNMGEILALLLQKNPRVRIVAAAITLETAAELTECVRRFGFTEAEVISLQVARSRAAGAYHLMTAQNQVYLFVLQRGEAP